MSEKIPKGWKKVKLGEAPIDIIDGDRGKNYPKKDDFLTSGYCLFLNTKNVTKNGFDFTIYNFISYEKEKLLRKGKLKRNDVVLTTRGTVGNVAFYNSKIKFDNIRINSGMVILRPKNGMEPTFNYFSIKYISSFLTEFISGSAQPQLPIRDLKEIEILLPPLPEQKAIASVLSSLDDKIDLLHRQNKTLEQMAETLYESWVIDKNFDSTIKDIINIQNGYAFKSKDFRKNGNHKILKIKNISEAIVNIENTDFIDENVVLNIDKCFKLKSGDILIAMTGAKIGKMGIIPRTEYSLWLNQRVGLLKEKYDGSCFFAYLHLKSDFGKDYIENTATGSAQPNISGTGIENCNFPKFSIQKIKEYSYQLKLIFDKVIFNLGEIRTLEKLRDTLLPKLITGKVRIKI